jgi:very-short-patch-repair endonuclease
MPMARSDIPPGIDSRIELPSRSGAPYGRELPPAYVARLRKDSAPLPRCWPVYSRNELLAAGWTWRHMAAAVRAGILIHSRMNTYLDPRAEESVLMACALGGQLACVSELARWGVFVLDSRSALHVRVPAGSARHRVDQRVHRLHWSRRARSDWASVDIVDALVDAIRCQPVRAAVATIDSALQLGLIGEAELDEVFAALPFRFRIIRPLLDRRAESGAESLMRLLLRQLGLPFDVQVRVSGVGRVDFLVDGWLIIECDSHAHHASWEQQKEDRRRDQAAAAQGLFTYRAVAEDIFWHPERVLRAMQGLRDARAGWASR